MLYRGILTLKECHGRLVGDIWYRNSYYHREHAQLEGASEAGLSMTRFESDVQVEQKTRSRLRDIFGNPFRPVILSPKCLTPTVQTLAQVIYQKQQFDQLPILADALEEAGCDNEDILKRCREEGEHVRGCWVVDKVLGKE